MATKLDTKKKRPWQDIAREAQQYRDASITQIQPELPQLPEDLPKDVTKIPATVLSSEEIQITEMLLEDLLSVMASADVSAVAVTTAFLRRAGLAQKLVCLEGCRIPLIVIIRKDRLIASQSSFLSEPWQGPNI